MYPQKDKIIIIWKVVRHFAMMVVLPEKIYLLQLSCIRKIVDILFLKAIETLFEQCRQF